MSELHVSPSDTKSCSPNTRSYEHTFVTESGRCKYAASVDPVARDLAAAHDALADVDEILAQLDADPLTGERRPAATLAAIVWTRDRALGLPLAHVTDMGPEFVAALTAAMTALAALLRQERDRRLRREGHRRTRQDDD